MQIQFPFRNQTIVMRVNCFRMACSTEIENILLFTSFQNCMAGVRYSLHFIFPLPSQSQTFQISPKSLQNNITHFGSSSNMLERVAENTRGLNGSQRISRSSSRSNLEGILCTDLEPPSCALIKYKNYTN